ncbi:peptidase C56 [Streptomyces sp. CB01635]|nr:peptidase C56 [Streptomyces sp. CB01635]
MKRRSSSLGGRAGGRGCWPVQRVRARDGRARTALVFDLNPAGTFPVDRLVADASVDDYDALLLPGGTMNPDQLRMDKDAVGFVKSFAESGKPIGVICHGPWTLAEADVVRGRRLTSWPSVRTDLRNAGAEVVDEEVVIDGQFISSRSPADLPAFCRAIVDQFARTGASR